MRLCLVSLPIKNERVVHPNIGLLFISRVLRNAGHDVRWIDLTRHALSAREAIDTIIEHKPDMVGISGMIVSYYYLEVLAKELKTRTNIPVVVGGNIAASALDVIEKNTEVDFCIIGEAENVFPTFLARFEGHRDLEDLSNIPGLYRRDKNGCFATSCEPDVPSDIDVFGFPDYASIDMEYYISKYRNYDWLFEKLSGQAREKCRAFPILTSRGCPFNCSFCFRLIKKVRTHSVDYTINHINLLKKEYGINFISIPDELMVASKEFAMSLLTGIVRANLGVYFVTGGARTNLMDKELLLAFKAANFGMICYGVESGSQRMLDIMNKKTKVEDNLRAIKMTIECGIESYFNLVMGMPGEDESSIQETENFLNKVCEFGFNMDRFTTYLAAPFPGTKLYDYAVNKGLIADKRKYLLELRGQHQYPINLSAFNTRDVFLKRISLMNERTRFMDQHPRNLFEKLKIVLLRKLSRSQLEILRRTVCKFRGI